MNQALGGLFPAILAAMLVVLLSSPLLIRAFSRLGLVDIPGSAPHKRHATVTPLAGGPVLALAVGLTHPLLQLPVDRLVQGILLGGIGMLVWGMIDDRFSLRPRTKIIGQIGAAGIALGFGIQVRITQNPWIDLPLTLLWMVGLINAFNFVDSMDGLALGLASIALAFFVLATLDAGQPALAALAAAILGGTLGLYFYNATPARLFLGDSGAQLLGFALAAIGIAYVPAGAGLPQGVSWFTPILVLGVPIFDTTLVVVSRLRKRRPVYQARSDHTYHRLVAMGMHPSRSVLAMQLAAILLALAAFIALDLSVLLANLVFGLILGCGVIAVGVLERAPIEA
jgi:UDP-GlcNAc:undecaprenyl-phosphate GlcNAc-1-phosphate transferase